MDEAVDGLMADDLVSNIAREAPRHLLGRPALREPVEDSLAQGIVALQPGSGPAPGIGLRLRIGGLVAPLGADVALHLARDGRRLAIQSCSDLPDRLHGLMKKGNRPGLPDSYIDRKGTRMNSQ